MSDNVKAFFSDAKDGLMYWRMAALRAFLYCYVVASNQFQQLTETYGGEAWAGLSAFEKARIYNCCASAAIVTLVAFLDSTMSRLTTAQPLSPEDKKQINRETT